MTITKEDKEQIKTIVREEVGKLLLPFAITIGDIKKNVTSLAENSLRHS